MLKQIKGTEDDGDFAIITEIVTNYLFWNDGEVSFFTLIIINIAHIQAAVQMEPLQHSKWNFYNNNVVPHAATVCCLKRSRSWFYFMSYLVWFYNSFIHHIQIWVTYWSKPLNAMKMKGLKGSLLEALERWGKSKGLFARKNGEWKGKRWGWVEYVSISVRVHHTSVLYSCRGLCLVLFSTTKHWSCEASLVRGNWFSFTFKHCSFQELSKAEEARILWEMPTKRTRRIYQRV